VATCARADGSAFPSVLLLLPPATLAGGFIPLAGPLYIAGRFLLGACGINTGNLARSAVFCGCGPCRPIDFASARPDGGNDKAVRLWMLPGGTPTNREGCLCRRHPDLTALGLQVCRRSTADPLVLTPVRLLDNTEDWRSERRCAPKSLILFAPIRSCSRFRWSDGCKVPRKNNNLAAPTRLKSPSNRHALAAHPPRDG
jgi:hypothetical protein